LLQRESLVKHSERRFTMNEGLSDPELIALIQSGKAEGLNELYSRYEKLTYALAYRMVQDAVAAEEVVEQVFARIWSRVDQFDVSLGGLTNWMLALTRTVSAELLRKRRIRTQKCSCSETPEQVLPDAADEGTDMIRPRAPVTAPRAADFNKAAGDEDERREGERVRKALERLAPDQRQVVESIFYQGCTHQEVSRRHSLPFDTVNSRARSALKQLQQRLPASDREGSGNELQT
jgi:RNA polymerase sigma factor (sigma-70 family)